MEPEYMDHGILVPACDVYSAGLTMMFMLFGLGATESKKLHSRFLKNARRSLADIFGEFQDVLAECEWNTNVNALLARAMFELSMRFESAYFFFH